MGAAVRAWCYRALGRLFTFEFAILSNHKLITSWPIRLRAAPIIHGRDVGACWSHPRLRYAGGYDVSLPCGVYRVGTASGVSVVVVSTALMVDRCIREDRVLHATFKRDWEEWRQRVRWRLIPWVF
ncbi:hypothetical protein F5141DRAFT_1104281 [Pisolithus sp. B1]|nr:hypothetical protein F5141DRAFT_1104281 [Pisolithus sp. B1]